MATWAAFRPAGSRIRAKRTCAYQWHLGNVTQRLGCVALPRADTQQLACLSSFAAVLSCDQQRRTPRFSSSALDSCAELNTCVVAVADRSAELRCLGPERACQSIRVIDTLSLLRPDKYFSLSPAFFLVSCSSSYLSIYLSFYPVIP